MSTGSGGLSGADAKIMVDVRLRMDKLASDLKDFEGKVDASKTRVNKGGYKAFGGLGYASRYLVMAYKLGVAFGFVREAARGAAAAVELIGGNTEKAGQHMIAMSDAIQTMPGGIGTAARELGNMIDVVAGLFGVETRDTKRKRMEAKFKAHMKSIADQIKRAKEISQTLGDFRTVERRMALEQRLATARSGHAKAALREHDQYEAKLRKLNALEDKMSRMGIVDKGLSQRLAATRQAIVAAYTKRVQNIGDAEATEQAENQAKTDKKRLIKQKQYADHISRIEADVLRLRARDQRTGYQAELALIDMRASRLAAHGTAREKALLRELTVLEKIQVLETRAKRDFGRGIQQALSLDVEYGAAAQAAWSAKYTSQQASTMRVEGQDKILAELKTIRDRLTTSVRVSVDGGFTAVAG